ncbi:MAG: hypothetical protein Q9169_005278 [Polycauliona sp. 2 TL-2023]
MVHINRFGLTEVFGPAGGSNVDVVLVHGINGHPSETWTSEEHNVFWPRELLPRLLEKTKARVLVYGYDADIDLPTEEATSSKMAPDHEGHLHYRTPHDGISQDRVHNHAEQLVQTMCANRRTHQATDHPIVFVAHSLGGIVVKRALIYSAGKGGPKTKRLRSIALSTYGILFLGTPHFGLNSTRWTDWSHKVIRTTLENGLQARLLETLRPSSETLQNIERQFIELASDLHIFYFHEMEPTKLGDKLQYIVDEASAAPVIQDVERAGIQQDHIHMCTFENEDTPGFALVADAIQRYATDAPETIRRRWLTEPGEQQLRLVGGTSSGLARQSKTNPSAQTSGALAQSNYAATGTTNPVKPQLEKHYLVPWNRVKTFVGRETQLEEIATYFNSASIQQPRVLVLHALGGQGKSQIVLEYCQRWRKHYQGVFWVNATTRSLALQSYAGIATALSSEPQAKFEDGEQVIQTVRNLLEDWKGSWLLIFDNYDKPHEFDDIRQFFPRAELGRVIITTRRRDLDRLGDLMPLDALSPDDGVNLLLRGYERQEIDENLEVAKEIICRLGGLALAIDQAGAYIAHRRIPSHQLQGFLAAYETQRKQIMSYTPKNLWDYGLMQTLEEEDQTKAINAFTTWEISMKQLVKDSPGEREAILRFLRLSAYFNPAKIEESLFRNYWVACRGKAGIAPKPLQRRRIRDYFKRKKIKGIDTTHDVTWLYPIGAKNNVGKKTSSHVEPEEHWDTNRFWDLLTKIHNLSLVQNIDRDAQGASFSLHPLVRDWLQHRGRTVDHSQFMAEGFAILGSTADIHQKDYSFSYAKVSIDQRAALVSHIDACLLSEETLCEDQKRIGNNKTSYDIARTLAFSYFGRGRHDSAEQLLRRITKIDDVHIVYFADLLSVLNAQGKGEEVLESSHRCRRYHEKSLDEGDRDRLNFKSELSRALVELQRYDEAESLQRQTLQLAKKYMGESHWQTLETMADLAHSLLRQDEYEKSEALAREALALCEANLPKDDPTTLRAMETLAGALRCQDKCHEAETLQREMVQAEQSFNGMEHPETLISMNNLAWILKSTKTEEAEELYRYVVQKRIKVLRKGHPYTLNSMSGLADLLRSNGQDEEADKIEREIENLEEAT